MVLLDKGHLPVLVTKREKVSVVTPIEKLLSRRLLHLAFEVGDQVIAVRVDMVRLAAKLTVLQAIIRDHSITCSSRKGWQEIFVCEKVVVDGAGLDDTRPTDQSGDPITTFKVGCLLSSIRRAAAIGPCHHLRAIVRRVYNDRVVGDAQIIQLLQQLADMSVMLNHSVSFDSQS